MKRDIIKEIAEKKSRNQKDIFLISYLQILRLEELFLKFKQNDKYDLIPHDFVTYFPIKIIASLEHFFRSAIKQFLDINPNVLERAVSNGLFSNVKLDVNYLLAIKGNDISIGDILAHHLSISKIEHLLDIFKKLFGCTLLQKLNEKNRHLDEKELEALVTNYDRIIYSLDQMYKLRHRVAHEIIEADEIQIKDFEEILDDTMIFIKVLISFFTSQFIPTSSKNSSQLRKEQALITKASKLKLETVISKVEVILDEERLELFKSAQKSFDEFCDYQSEFIALEWKGGLLQPFLKNIELENLYEYRADVLQRLLKEFHHFD